MTEHIAFYGKRGTGKLNLATNVSLSLANSGYSVLYIGCDPFSAALRNLNNSVNTPRMLDYSRKGLDFTLDSIIHTNSAGITSIELGEPDISGGCAYAEMALAFEQLNRLALYETMKPDYVLYDISCDIYCGGCFSPLQQITGGRVFIVASADMMSLYVANNLFKALEQFKKSVSAVPFGGLILNSIRSSIEESFVDDFAEQTNARITGIIPNSLIGKQHELTGNIDSYGTQSYFYSRLTGSIIDRTQTAASSEYPLAMGTEEMRDWARDWNSRLRQYNSGFMYDGSGI